MSKIFIVEDCTKCPNFIPCTSPKDFRVGCTKLGNLGSPLNLIGDGFPIDCPLNDYEESILDKIIAEIESHIIDLNGLDFNSALCIAIEIINNYKAEK